MLFGAQIKEFPSQKKSLKEKNKAWRKECVDASESLVFFQNSGIRQRRLQKKVNYDLYNGVINKADMERICNPYGIKIDDFPTEPKNYPITNPYIQSLKGEEQKRRFDWKVVVINEDAVSDKEQELKAKTIEYLKEVVMRQLDGEEVEDAEIEKRIKYLKYDYQDMREISATRILDYYTRYLDVKPIFSAGWEDWLLVGEELYAIDEINNNPIIRRCNPLNTYYLTSPTSNKLEDSDIVVEEAYIPLGQVIDMFYDDLTADEIDMIGRKQGPTATNDATLGYASKPLTFLDTETGTGNYIDTDNVTFATMGGAYDNQGNVRVVRTVWRSLKKVGVLTIPNPEGGEDDKITVSEEYKLSPEEKAQGIELKWIWINEAWEGTKIAGHIYVKMQPRKIQFRKLDDLSYCSLGYVGTMYNTNSNKVMSLFDIMKPYQYAYNAYAYRLELANIKSYGKIGELDLAEIPDGWTEDQYLYYATIMGFRVKDSFKEARKGAATGKIVGNMTGHSNVMDMEQRSMIEQGLQMLNYFDQQLAVVTGINRQRQGQISGDDGLGTTQEAKAASATITEDYFVKHDNTKLRVLKHLLETAKFCVKNGNKKIQNVLDDMTTAIYSIEGDQVNEAEYGIIVSNASDDAITLQALQRATEMAVQTGAVNITQMMDIYANDSMASKRRKIEEVEEKKQEREQQQIQHEQEIAQQEHELAAQIHEEEKQERELDRQLEKYKIDTEAQTKIETATISALGFAKDTDVDKDMIPDVIEQSKLALDQQKHYADIQNKQLIEANKLKQHNDKVKLEKDKLESQQKIEELKIKQTEIQNKSQEKIAREANRLKEKEIAVKKIAARKKPTSNK